MSFENNVVLFQLAKPSTLAWPALLRHQVVKARTCVLEIHYSFRNVPRSVLVIGGRETRMKDVRKDRTAMTKIMIWKWSLLLLCSCSHPIPLPKWRASVVHKSICKSLAKVVDSKQVDILAMLLPAMMCIPECLAMADPHGQKQSCVVFSGTPLSLICALHHKFSAVCFVLWCFGPCR